MCDVQKSKENLNKQLSLMLQFFDELILEEGFKEDYISGEFISIYIYALLY